jgi:N-acetylglutamate synthase-like GNAT family acetyltransferase/SAM-dependent methyltransferase
MPVTEAGAVTGLTLRPAEPADVPGIVELLQQAGLGAEDAGSLLEGAVVAWRGGDAVGVAAVEVHGLHGLLRSVAVAEVARGGGVGETLTRDRVAWARARGLEALWLLTTTAAGFFERLGFAAVGRETAPAGIASSSQYLRECPASATLMRLTLVAAGPLVGLSAGDGGALRAAVREKYAAAAQRAAAGGRAACGCGCGDDAREPITGDLYDAVQAEEVPSAALLASLGCGNPTALAELGAGETVLDLGSGGGIDVLLSARRVGPTGKVYGLDMTDEMLALARENQRRAGVANVEWLKGEMESIPLPDASVDVIISNCVINLSADKRKVLAEAFRVLRPGGRFAVSDIVMRGEVPPEVRRSIELWSGCIAGALSEDEYRQRLVDAGFEAVDVEPTRIYELEDTRAFLEDAGVRDEGVVAAAAGKVMSAFVRARRPA